MTNLTDLPVHPAADMFPMLGDAELHELAEDIKANGLHEPVWLWKDPDRGPVLLDGRNRVAACAMVGAAAHSQYYQGSDPVAFVVSMNMRRRHLTPDQRAELVVKLRADGMSVRTIAEATGVPKSTVARDLSQAGQPKPETVTGRDGKTYQASKPVAFAKNDGRI